MNEMKHIFSNIDNTSVIVLLSSRISDFFLEQVISVSECKRDEHEEHVKRDEIDKHDEDDEHDESEVGPSLKSIQQIWISKLEKIKQ